jgi:hypothetical protein
VSLRHGFKLVRRPSAVRGLLFALAIASFVTAVNAEGEKPASPPAADQPADSAVYGIELSADDREHWAFRPIQSVSPPRPAKQAEWIGNPIDAFVLQKLHEKGLAPSAPADDRTWLRRVSFDLVGLPPTPEQMDAFLADPSPEKRERAVDRLLADPGYGVRWGRHWLDVVRYADTNGYERDGDKQFAWRYRDWVVDSLNADKPFDRFLTEQLAGDELDGANAETMIATTFLRLGTWDDEPADPLVDRYDQLDDILGTVSATFLGQTLRCARCHNHKFEPFSQIDYARMLAVFEPLEWPRNDRTELHVPVGTREEIADFHAATARTAAAINVLQEQIKSLDTRVRERYLAAGVTKLAADAFAAHKQTEQERTDSQKKLVKETQKQFDAEVAAARTPDEQKERTAFEKSIESIRAATPALPHAYLMRESPDRLPVTHVFRRGDPTTPAGTVAPGVPAVMVSSRAADLSAAKSPHSSRRRLALAHWLTSPENTLTARVIVNRIWQGHFGEGLVVTENDFGVMGDLLASTLRSDGWSLKSLHRLIVLSSTYGQSSARREDGLRADVDNRLLWRFPYRRLDAEAVRDSILFVSGTLNLEQGGPGVYPKIAREVLEGQSRPGLGWGKSDDRQASRRSIYIHVKRSLLVPELEILDFADTTTSCEQRPVSTIPTQALTLLNGEFVNEQARHFASRLVREAGTDAEPGRLVERAYRLLLSRSPTDAEKSAAVAFIDRQWTQIAAETGESGASSASSTANSPQQSLCVVLFNLNEFVYVE